MRIIVALALALTVTPAIAAVAFSNQGETYEQDRAWQDQFKDGPCSRIRDRRTDSPADIAGCHHQYAQTPLCVSYKNFASIWFDMAANPPNPDVNFLAFQTDVINTLGAKMKDDDPPYYKSPQFKEMLRRLVSVTFSPARTKWSTRDQFADCAYKICMEGHPF